LRTVTQPHAEEGGGAQRRSTEVEDVRREAEEMIERQRRSSWCREAEEMEAQRA